MSRTVWRNECRHKECPAIENGKCLYLGKEATESDGDKCPVPQAYREFYSQVHHMGFALVKKVLGMCAAKLGEAWK